MRVVVLYCYILNFSNTFHITYSIVPFVTLFRIFLDTISGGVSVSEYISSIEISYL
jgi:hypothetical protein